MRWNKDPEVGRTYMTEEGILYFVLSVTFDANQMKMKYLVLSDEHVNTRYLKHLMDVGEIGDYAGPANLKWTDQRVG